MFSNEFVLEIDEVFCISCKKYPFVPTVFYYPFFYYPLLSFVTNLRVTMVRLELFKFPLEYFKHLRTHTRQTNVFYTQCQTNVFYVFCNGFD